jgi:hypothetical protein
MTKSYLHSYPWKSVVVIALLVEVFEITIANGLKQSLVTGANYSIVAGSHTRS